MERERKICVHGSEQRLILTDDQERAAALKKAGICCIGISDGSDFFPGVDFVTDDPEGVSDRMLSLAWHRFRHLPYILFEDGPVMARESIAKDYDVLADILDTCRGILTFSPDREWFNAYVLDGYRLAGYGMWTVLFRNDSGMEIAGWCGLGPAGEEKEEKTLFLREAGKPSECRLELGFVIREDLRGRGIAKKVCREAIDYAAEVLGEEPLLIRTDKENIPAQRLALSLGFHAFSGSGYSVPKVSTVIL